MSARGCSGIRRGEGGEADKEGGARNSSRGVGGRMNWLFADVEWSTLRVDYEAWWFDEFGENDWVYGGIRWKWYMRCVNMAPPSTMFRGELVE